MNKEKLINLSDKAKILIMENIQQYFINALECFPIKSTVKKTKVSDEMIVKKFDKIVKDKKKKAYKVYRKMFYKEYTFLKEYRKI